MPINLNSNSSKSRLANCSKPLADVPRGVHDRCLRCEVWYRLAVDCDVRITHVGIAESEAGKWAGESEPVSALAYFKC